MNKIKTYITEFLKDGNSKNSYKRLSSICCFAEALYQSHTGGDIFVIGLWLCGATGVAISTIFEVKK